MASERRVSAESRDYPPQIRRICETVGENIPRFLDRDLVERGPKHTSTSGRDLFVARVRGIDRIGVANAWIMVERELAEFHDREPRVGVIELLERRRDHLIEHGDRQELTPEELAESRAARSDDVEDDPEPVWRHINCGTTDVERESSRDWFCNTCDLRTNRVELVDDEELQDDEADVAIADGGSP